MVGKIFEGGMLIRILPTTPLQIFCKIILNSQVIVKSIIGPDDNFSRNSRAYFTFNASAAMRVNAGTNHV